MGGDGVGEVAGRGAGDGVEAQLLRLGDGDGDDAVLEGVGRVGGVVLDPELGVEPEALGEAVGAQQRRQAGLERVAGATLEGQEVGVAPDSLRAGLDLALGLGRVETGEVVGDFQRPEAVLTGEMSAEVVRRPALLALQVLDCHPISLSVANEKDLRLVGQRSDRTLPHIFQVTATCWSWHLPRTRRFEMVAGASTGQSLHPS